MYHSLFKRILDFFFSLFGFILISPIFIIIAMILLIVNRGTPFFTQIRPGKNEKLFKLIKFKTMNDKKDTNDKLLPDAKRLTTMGKFVRSTSLDELPQLLNVVKGDMSLIGPRPLLVKYLPRYSKIQARRHEIRPGITGWAQINGRNNVSWNKKFELDVFYVDHISFLLDVRIFYLTLIKVFKREGISSNNAATMEEFVGDN